MPKTKKSNLPKKVVKVKVTRATSGSKLPSKKIKVVVSQSTPILDKVTVATLPPPATARPVTKVRFWQYATWFSGVVLVVLLVGVFMVFSRYNNGELKVRNLTNENVAGMVGGTGWLSPLTGEPVTEEVATRRPLAVVIENFKTVRPQSGLSFADIVWEAPTEGGLTRFLAIFQKGLPSRLGPVRSARSYFIDWAREYGAIYAHSGGSPEALDELAKGVEGLQDVNEFFYGPAYWRDDNLSAPHNLFTDAAKFYDYAKERDWRVTAQSLEPFIITPVPEATGGVMANEIIVPYVPLDYDVMWNYDTAAGVYKRLMDGKEHVDKTTNGILQTKNLVVMFTDVTPIPKDPELRVNITTVGGGLAYVFVDGQMFKGKWERTSLSERTKFVYEDGAVLPLQPGNTWISVIDSVYEDELEYK